MEKTYITKNQKQTQRLGEKLAVEILRYPKNKMATILCLNGNLGGGKTTFLQGFAKGLGIENKILSPTFVIVKKFLIKDIKKVFYHIDCYRLQSYKDILEIFSDKGGLLSGWKKIISDPDNIIALEWPEKIKKALPKKVISISFKFINKNSREIKF